jgi:hypothetical protein
MNVTTDIRVLPVVYNLSSQIFGYYKTAQALADLSQRKNEHNFPSPFANGYAHTAARRTHPNIFTD